METSSFLTFPPAVIPGFPRCLHHPEVPPFPGFPLIPVHVSRSAEHRRGRILGRLREGQERLVPGRMRGGGADAPVRLQARSVSRDSGQNSQWNHRGAPSARWGWRELWELHSKGSIPIMDSSLGSSTRNGKFGMMEEGRNWDWSAWKREKSRMIQWWL